MQDSIMIKYKTRQFITTLIYNFGFSPKEVEFLTGEKVDVVEHPHPASYRLARRRRSVMTAFWNRVHANEFNVKIYREKMFKDFEKIYCRVLADVLRERPMRYEGRFYSSNPDEQLLFQYLTEFVASMLRVYYYYPGMIPDPEVLTDSLVDKGCVFYDEIKETIEMITADMKEHSVLLDFIHNKV